MTPTTTRKADGGSVGDVLAARRRAGPRPGHVGAERGRVPRPGQVRARPLHRGRVRRAVVHRAAPATRSRPGFAVGARVGYDIFRFFAVQAHLLGSTHQIAGRHADRRPAAADVPGDGRGEADAAPRCSGRSSPRAAWARRACRPTCSTRAGLARYRTGFTAGGGGGIDYHFLSRHFSVGLRGGYYVLRDVTSSQDLIVDHLPEVHVLMRARGVAAAAGAAAPALRARLRDRRSRRAARRHQRLPAQPAVLHRRRSGPTFLAKDDYGGEALLRLRLPRRAGRRTRWTLIVPDDPPPGTDPADRATGRPTTVDTEQMNCSNVAASKLLELPAGLRVHGGGKLIRARRPRGDAHQDGWMLAAVSPPSGRRCRRRVAVVAGRRRRAPTIRRWCA